MGLETYAASWAVNFVIFAVVAALADEATGDSLEKHHGVALFLLFGMPTAVELLSFLVDGKAFFF